MGLGGQANNLFCLPHIGNPWRVTIEALLCRQIKAQFAQLAILDSEHVPSGGTFNVKRPRLNVRHVTGGLC